MALHKTIGEIREMPYPEFRRWKLIYLVKPWGFDQMEYWFASLRAEVYNAHHKTPKGPKDFMRDMLQGILDQLKPKPKVEDFTRDELIAIVKRDLGIK